MSTLFHRAFALTSNWNSFHTEISYLHQYFIKNCYPSKLFYKCLHKFLNNIFIPKLGIPTVSKLPFYASVPLIYNQSFYQEINKIVCRHIPAIDLKLVQSNPLSIGSLFRVKERLDPFMTSGVIYLFNCPQV